MDYCNMLHHRLILKTCLVEEIRWRVPHIVWFPLHEKSQIDIKYRKTKLIIYFCMPNGEEMETSCKGI
jgi:hypothetical protein